MVDLLRLVDQLSLFCRKEAACCSNGHERSNGHDYNGQGPEEAHMDTDIYGLDWLLFNFDIHMDLWIVRRHCRTPQFTVEFMVYTGRLPYWTCNSCSSYNNSNT